MKERPILFSAAMVRAILDGRKTMTRRVCKHQPMACRVRDVIGFIPGPLKLLGPESPHGNWPDDIRDNWIKTFCPYGTVGDRLWVREACWLRPECTPRMMREGADTWPPVIYSADGEDEFAKSKKWTRRPSIHMPRWASRLTLEITGVRVERLQSMTMSDMDAEGTPFDASRGLDGDKSRLNWLIGVWNQLNGKKHPWKSNPWVWAISFKRMEANDAR